MVLNYDERDLRHENLEEEDSFSRRMVNIYQSLQFLLHKSFIVSALMWYWYASANGVRKTWLIEY